MLVLSVDTERGRWPLGRVIELNKGVDGNIRSANVLVGGKIYSRGINTLSLIVSSNDSGVFCEGPKGTLSRSGDGGSKDDDERSVAEAEGQEEEEAKQGEGCKTNEGIH